MIRWLLILMIGHGESGDSPSAFDAATNEEGLQGRLITFAVQESLLHGEWEQMFRNRNQVFWIVIGENIENAKFYPAI